ncbi:hypothetical protein BD779DRAFT_1150089 [Infundibulicybe gibba]|nr:hypothetical protein BD779DRAFT_1150089 [Infundibulicybe gibba]
MKEAESSGACFDGVIGRIKEDPTPASSVGVTSKDVNGEFFLRTGEPNEFNDSDRRSSREQVLHIPSCPKFQRMSPVPTPRAPSLFRAPYPLRVLNSYLERLSPAIARLISASVRSMKNYSESMRDNPNVRVAGFTCFAIGFISFAVVGGLSGFHPGGSTKMQRVLVMLWLVFGVVIGGLAASMLEQIIAAVAGLRVREREYANDFNPDGKSRNQHIMVIIAIVGLTYGAPAIGGFVVGRMLFEYGNCVRLG